MGREFPLLLLLLLSSRIQSYNILVASPLAFKSNCGLFSSIANAYAEAGHSVTFLSCYEMPQQHPNVKFVHYPKLAEVVENLGGTAFDFRRQGHYKGVINEQMVNGTHIFWSDERSMELWRNRTTFDAFVKPSIWVDYLYPFLINASMPLIHVCTPGVEPVSLAMGGNWVPPSIMPAMILNMDDQMSFWERFINLPAYIIGYKMFISNNENVWEATKKYFPDFPGPFEYSPTK